MFLVGLQKNNFDQRCWLNGQRQRSQIHKSCPFLGLFVSQLCTQKVLSFSKWITVPHHLACIHRQESRHLISFTVIFFLQGLFNEYH